MSQVSGVVGSCVRNMIRRAVRRSFHSVYVSLPDQPLRAPLVLYANHHGWHDGYLMLHLIERLGLECVDWIEEFDAFPLFKLVGGMRFTKGDTYGRASTMKKTISLMREGKSLVIFPEGVLHRPPTVLPLGRSLELIANKVPSCRFSPVAILYDMSLHERPEAFLSIGAPEVFVGLAESRQRLEDQLARLASSVAAGDRYEILAHGTKDVNERWDLRRGRIK